MPAKVAAVEYDPNRSARIALLHYADGEKRYILAPVGLRVGDQRRWPGREADIKPGNSPAAREHPARHDGAQRRAASRARAARSVRSAGGAAQLMAKEGDYALLKLPSGELRRVRIDVPRDDRPGRQPRAREHLASARPGARAGSAGARSVRGIAMNPVDHPHGGGEGRSKGNHPQTPWGKPTKGYKTRHNKRTDRFIVSAAKK